MAKKKGADVVEPAVEEKSGGKKKRLLIIGGLVLVLAMLGGGAMAGGLVGGGAGAAGEVGPDGQPVAPEPTATPTPPELGRLVQLDSVTLNLAAGRFLKLGVAIELAPDVVEDPATAPIYDEVIALFGPMTFEELSDGAIRDQTKITLLERLAAVYGTDIVGIYYTEFVMQ